MKQGVLVYDQKSERMDVRFGGLLRRVALRHLHGCFCKQPMETDSNRVRLG